MSNKLLKKIVDNLTFITSKILIPAKLISV
jgi:hypothetical protein